MGHRLTLAQLAPIPGPTFDEPFDMLGACHERLERTLRLLERLVAHVSRRGSDASAQETAGDVLRYFDLAAPHHHLDEELHVFPLLEQQGDAATAHVVAKLRQDHVLLQTQWAAARGALHRLAEGEQQRWDEGEVALLESLASFYREHLRTEDTLAYPAARQVMSAQHLQAMSLEMQQRRTAAT